MSVTIETAPIQNLKSGKALYELEGLIVGNNSNTTCVVRLTVNTGGLNASCVRTNGGAYILTLNKPILDDSIYTIIRTDNINRSDMVTGEGIVTQFESVILANNQLGFMAWSIGEPAGLTNVPINNATICFTIKVYQND